MDYYYQVKASGPAGSMRKLEEESQLSFGCDGVEEFSLDEAEVDAILGDRAYSGGDIPLSVIDEVDACKTEGGDLTFNFYFYHDNARERAQSFVSYLESLSSINFSLSEEEWQDWNKEWRKHYKTLVISPNLRIIPEWERKEDDGEGSVYIYPGMGFGTGGHETTFLCLSALEKLINVDYPIESCLDFGCGSGILGVATIERTDAVVDFCDIDKSALQNTLQNLELNFGEEQLQGHSLVIRDRFVLQRTYDLVFANILQHILIEELETIGGAVRNGGYLILSGLLNNQVEKVITAYKKTGLKLEEILTRGEWSAVLMRRRS